MSIATATIPPGEVVRDALRLLADRDELIYRRKQALRKKIAQGVSIHSSEAKVLTEKNSSAGWSAKKTPLRASLGQHEAVQALRKNMR